jgi:hypothetical protein
MSVNDTSKIIIDDCRVMLQIVASLIDESKGIIYNCNMFIVQATNVNFVNLFSASLMLCGLWLYYKHDYYCN